MFKAIVKKDPPKPELKGGFGTFIVFEGPARPTFEAAQEDADRFMEMNKGKPGDHTLIVEIKSL